MIPFCGPFFRRIVAAESRGGTIPRTPRARSVKVFFPQQQNAMKSLRNIDFGVLWARWGGSGKEPGSWNRFQVSMGCAGGASRFRWVPTGRAFGRWFQGLNGFWQVPGSQGLRTGSGNWFRVSIGSEVRKVAMLSGEEVLNILSVGDTTYAYFFIPEFGSEGCVFFLDF